MGNAIKERVNRIVRKYDTRNPFEIAKLLGIEVQRGNLGISGCYMFLKNHRYIFLDQNLSDQELTQVMAHELGHAVLHRKQNCYFIRNKTLLLNSKIEIEANTFAAELLIPDEIVFTNSDLTESQIARLVGYDEYLMRFKRI